MSDQILKSISKIALSRGLQIIAALMIILFLVFFLIPLSYFLLLSFFTFVQSGQFSTALTLANYQRLISDVFYLRILGATFQLGLAACGVCFVLGYPIAYLLGRSTSRWRNIVLAIVVASLFTNLVVRTFGWIVTLSPHGVFNNILMQLGLIKEPLDLMFNMTGVVIGVAQIQLPVFIMVVASVIQMIDPNLEYAAKVMGADDLQAFLAVVWPLSLRGTIGGLSLVFALSISSYITPQFLSGGKVIFAALFINTLVTKTLNYPLAGALSAVLILTSLAVVGGMAWSSRKYAQGGVQ
jgi:putative spermidine/putrescine transport system permease protein